MMANINLRTIFCHLINDSNFLSIITEDTQSSSQHNGTSGKKYNPKNKVNIMANMVTEYNTLSPYETQNYVLFPHIIKPLLTPDYERLGIKGIMEKNFEVINISFLHSLNIILRTDIYFI